MEAATLPRGSLTEARIDGRIPEGVVVLLLSKGCTLEEIGAAFDVTRERIRQVAMAGRFAPRPYRRHQKERLGREAWPPYVAHVAEKLEALGHTVAAAAEDGGRRQTILYVGGGIGICVHHVPRVGPCNPSAPRTLYAHTSACRKPLTTIYVTPACAFVVPFGRTPTRGKYVMLPQQEGWSKWQQFREAWHLIPVAAPAPDLFTEWVAAMNGDTPTEAQP